MKLLTQSFGKIRTEIRDAKTGDVVKRSGFTPNLVFDVGLNYLANGSAGFASMFQTCRIGSGTNPNSVASGAVTFTQTAFAITASIIGWFTANNVVAGSVFKYGSGTGGAESTIISIDGTGTIATVSVSATVTTPTVATVWFVTQTSLQTLLFTSNTYDTSTGANTTAIVSNTITIQRTIVFPVQASLYTVNEIGYNSQNFGTGVLGRIVLPSSDVVSPTQFYVVVIVMTFTVSPSAPLAVANIGTNFNTAGSFMQQCWCACGVDANGNNLVYNGGTGLSGNIIDGSSFAVLVNTNNNITLNGSISAAAPQGLGGTGLYRLGNTAQISNTSQPIGVGSTGSVSYSTTTNGETVYSIFFGGGGGGVNAVIFALVLTTPQVLPVGVFAGNFSCTSVFTRTLSN